MRHEAPTRDDILATLRQQQIDAAGVVGAEEAERIGVREVELVRGDRRVWAILRALCGEGLITRSSGYCWLKQDGEEEERVHGIEKR